jgi:hypothetical protein
MHCGYLQGITVKKKNRTFNTINIFREKKKKKYKLDEREKKTKN